MNKTKILLIDDDRCLLRLMQLRLSKACDRYDVRVEHRSHNALATAREFLPDIILLDVNMPGKDGGDVVWEMGEDPFLCKTPIVFVTSLISRRESGGGQITSGGMRYLPKTTDPLVLMECIESNLKSPEAVGR